MREGPIIGSSGEGQFKYVITLIAGNAFVTGFNTIVVDRKDPFQHGFTVGDIWG